MTGSWRTLALAAALTVAAGAGVATAQTVSVKNAPPGMRVEVFVNALQAGTADAGPDGVATIVAPAAVAATLPDPGLDVRVYVDTCPDVRRVLIAERYQAPPDPGPACSRREIAGVFRAARVTSFVVDVTENDPSLRLRQGSAPEQWLKPESASLEDEENAKPPFDLPKGLSVFGGAGLSSLANAATVYCGSLDCAGGGSSLSFTAGAEAWLTRAIAITGSYAMLAKTTMTYKSDTFGFESFVQGYVLTFAGKFGVPLGRSRVYGFGSGSNHRSWSSTTQTQQEQTFTIKAGTEDQTTVTIPGGTQSWGMRTEGWGWLYGGGLEVWINRRWAVYGDLTITPVKGRAMDGIEGEIDDRATLLIGGIRIHLGR